MKEETASNASKQLTIWNESYPASNRRTNRFSKGYKSASDRERARYVHPDGSRMAESLILFREFMAKLKK